MATLTLRNFPADLHERLKARARANGRSLNAELNAILLEASLELDEEAILEEARRLRAEGAARGE